MLTSKRILPIIVVGFLVALALSSLSAMIGDIQGHQAKRLERQWESSAVPPSSQQWHSAYQHLLSAVSFSPNHPDYLLSLGRLFSWGLFVPEPDGVTEREPSQGLDYFRQSIAQRPYWPYAWGELTLLKAQLGQLDKEFEHAFLMARQLGPNEKQVQMNLLNAGLGAWGQLSWALKVEVNELFQQMIQTRGRDYQALGIAENHGMKLALCYGVESLQVRKAIIRRCNRP